MFALLLIGLSLSWTVPVLQGHDGQLKRMSASLQVGYLNSLLLTELSQNGFLWDKEFVQKQSVSHACWCEPWYTNTQVRTSMLDISKWWHVLGSDACVEKDLAHAGTKHFSAAQTFLSGRQSCDTFQSEIWECCALPCPLPPPPARWPAGPLPSLCHPPRLLLQPGSDITTASSGQLRSAPLLQTHGQSRVSWQGRCSTCRTGPLLFGESYYLREWGLK